MDAMRSHRHVLLQAFVGLSVTEVVASSITVVAGKLSAQWQVHVLTVYLYISGQCL